MAEQAGGAITKGVAYATITGLGLSAVGSILASKPKFYQGSRDSSGAYSEIGGNSSGDTQQGIFRSGELIVQAGRDANIAKNALNGRSNGGGNNITIGAPSIVIQGNADSNVMEQLNEFTQNFTDMVSQVIEQKNFTNSFNPAF